MDIAVVDGVYTVTFLTPAGMAELLACATDQDCYEQTGGGFAMCVTNQTWTSAPTMCVCPLGMYSGALCDTPTAWFTAVYAMNIFSALIVGLSCLLAVATLILLFRGGEKLRLQNAMHTTLGLSAMGSFLICVNSSFGADKLVAAKYVLNPTSDDWSGGWISEAPGGQGMWVRSKEFTLTNSAAIALAFFFVTASLLNVSLVWIEIGDSSKKLSARASGNISSYRHALFVYYAVFLTAVISVVAVHRITFAVYVAAPAMAFIVVAYVLGSLKMRALMSSLLGDSLQVEPKSGKDRVRKLRRAMRLVTVYSGVIAVLTLVILILFLAFALTGSFRNWRPDGNQIEVLNGVNWILIAIDQACVVAYAVQSALPKLTRSPKAVVTITVGRGGITSSAPHHVSSSKTLGRDNE
jgi:hypothetical protein